MSDAPDRVEDSVLNDLRRRVRETRRVSLPAGVGWRRGTDAEYLTELLSSWATDYNWRTHEERIRAWPWAQTTAGRAVHQRSADSAATTVVLLHGWPDSVLRFERVLPLLGDLHVVVPCLPGYPFGAPVATPGMSITAMADGVAKTMADLGYDRYVVSGGDIGSGVAEALAFRHGDHVRALHLTDVPFHHVLSADASELTAAEQEYLAAGRRWQTSEGAYSLEQATRPHTLAVGLGDSPAGLASWIVEKLRAWSDCDGDVESVWSREEILTWVTAYWVTGTIGTSFSPYCERPEPVGRVDVPTAVTIFPQDLVTAPREVGERIFDVRVWEVQPDGGHFGAWERPDAYAAGLRAAVALN